MEYWGNVTIDTRNNAILVVLEETAIRSVDYYSIKLEYDNVSLVTVSGQSNDFSIADGKLLYNGTPLDGIRDWELSQVGSRYTPSFALRFLAINLNILR